MRDLIYKTSERCKVASYLRIGHDQESSCQYRKLKDGFGYVYLSNESDSAFELSKDLALLLFSLSEPSLLPEYYRRNFGHNRLLDLLELVRLNFIEVKIESSFLSGVEAVDVLNNRYADIHNRLCAISENAVRRSVHLNISNVQKNFQYLYTYNTFPIHPQSKLEYANDLDFIFSSGFNQNSWNVSSNIEGWHYFVNHSGLAKTKKSNYKLYISPVPRNVPLVMQAAGKVLASIKDMSFKVGRGIEGLARPDKMIAYFSSYDLLSEAADRILEETKGVEAQGVPFSVAIDSAGLLSWGMDVYTTEGENQSWRQWMVNSIIQSIGDGNMRTPDEAWTDVSMALHNEGIDPWTFIPNERWKQRYQKI